MRRTKEDGWRDEGGQKKGGGKNRLEGQSMLSINFQAHLFVAVQKAQ